MSADTTLVLSGPRLADGRTVDVRIAGERIEAVGTAGSLTTPHPPDTAVPRPGDRQHPGMPASSAAPLSAAQISGTLDLSGYLLLPAPAEPHAHLDTALSAVAGPPAGPPTGSARPGGTGAPSPTEPRAHGPSLSCPPEPCPPEPCPPEPDETRHRMTEAALLQLGHGATALRSHIRVGDVAGLRLLEAALDARRALRGLADLTLVATPRLLTGRAGADARALLHDAAAIGAAALGGIPDLDPDPAGYVEILLEIAAEHGTAVDLHTEGGDPARLARLAAAAGGLRTRVAIGPCTGLSRMPAETAGRTAERLAAAGVTVTCLPQGPCGLIGPLAAALPYPSPGNTPVRMLRAAGVQVAAGSGALRDAANPVGRGDPLEAAYLLAAHGEADAANAYAAVSDSARAALGLEPVRIEAGFPAELLAVRGDSLDGALSLSYSRIVIHRGRVVTRTSAFREYCADLPRMVRPSGSTSHGTGASNGTGSSNSARATAARRAAGGSGADGIRGTSASASGELLGAPGAPGDGGFPGAGGLDQPGGGGGSTGGAGDVGGRGTVHGDGVLDMPRQLRDDAREP